MQTKLTRVKKSTEKKVAVKKTKSSTPSIQTPSIKLSCKTMKFAVVSLICLFLSLVQAHNVLLPPYGKHCFFENLKQNDQLAVSFQVGSRDPGNAEQFNVDFVVSIVQNPTPVDVNHFIEYSHFSLIDNFFFPFKLTNTTFCRFPLQMAKLH